MSYLWLGCGWPLILFCLGEKDGEFADVWILSVFFDCLDGGEGLSLREEKGWEERVEGTSDLIAWGVEIGPRRSLRSLGLEQPGFGDSASVL